MLAKPRACTGKSRRSISRADGFRSVQAGAILGNPARKSGTLALLLLSPPQKVILPLEFQKNPFHTQPAVPTGPPNRNSKPPLSAVPAAVECGTARIGDGVPAPLSSSPRNGVF